MIAEKGYKEILLCSPKTVVLQLDYWTSWNGNVPYITLAIQFINDDFKLRCSTMTTEKFERPHTAARTGDFVVQSMNSVGLGDRQIIGLGDHGSNIVNLPLYVDKCITYIDCLGHSVHLIFSSDMPKEFEWNVIDDVLRKIKNTHGALCYQLHNLKEFFLKAQKEEINEYLLEIEEMIEAIKADEVFGPHADFLNAAEIIEDEYAYSSSGLENYSAFAKENTTRWFSSYELVKTYDKNFDAINALLAHVKRLDLKLSPTEFAIMKETKDMFKIMHECLKILQSESEFCSNMVIPFHHSILSKIDAKIDDPSVTEISGVYKKLKTHFIKRVKIHPEYLTASVLDPGQANLSYLGKYLEEAKLTHSNLIKDMIQKYNIHDSHTSKTSSIGIFEATK